jgi:uncharacterized protein
MPNPTALEQAIAEFSSVLVGYSGGVDSALVAVVAQQVLGGDRTVAALGVSASLSRAQHAQAVDVARSYRLNLVEVRTDELSEPLYVVNQPDRCYHCKLELWAKLSRLGRRLGMAVIADGTNADDLCDTRPGMAAAQQYRIRSPLADAGYTKEAVRAEARVRGIPIWDAPASPCLSSRVLYGLSVTPKRLGQVETAESYLRAEGVEGNLRVRHLGDEARIETDPSQFTLIRDRQERVWRKFEELGFTRVSLDLLGYRSGSLGGRATDQIELISGGR